MYDKIHYKLKKKKKKKKKKQTYTLKDKELGKKWCQGQRKGKE